MPTFSITDNAGEKIDGVTVDWTSASSLSKYLKSKLLHLIVVPDFVARKDMPLRQAAPNPINFDLKAGNTFQLGSTVPEIDFTPSTALKLSANTTRDSSLFEDDPFHATATVPVNTGYVGLTITGTLDLAVGQLPGAGLTFGFDQSTSVTLEFLKAFALGPGEPTLGSATGAMISDYVIPGDVGDFSTLQIGDVCAASGTGKLKVSTTFTVTTPVNPLASVTLPLGVGTINVQDGALAGLTAAVIIVGEYQIRVRRLQTGFIELSYLKKRGTTLKTDLTASAGVSAEIGVTDLLPKLLGAISTVKVDEQVLAGLTKDEIETFTGAIKEGVDHSLKASVDLALSTGSDEQAAFQYWIQPDLLDATGRDAVHGALKGDLSLLTALEEQMQPDGTLAPGLTLVNSLLSKVRTNGVALRVNLIGIVNLISISKLISKCEILTEPASGDLIIKETAQSDRITAITDPYDRQEKLRKAMFDSVMVTTTYVCSKAIALPDLACHNLHFAVNQNTNSQTIGDYLNWFVALDLLNSADKAQALGQFVAKSMSTCLLRSEFNDAACNALFFDSAGALRPLSDYLETGRRALQALLNAGQNDIDQFRYRFLDDENTWEQAQKIGPSPALRELIPLGPDDARRELVLSAVSGDLYDIVWWAQGMERAGAQLRETRQFLAGRDAAALAGDPAFEQQKNRLQTVMLNVAKTSKVRFHEPWGMVCLFRAAGSGTSSGQLVAGTIRLEKQRLLKTKAGTGD